MQCIESTKFIMKHETKVYNNAVLSEPASEQLGPEDLVTTSFQHLF